MGFSFPDIDARLNRAPEAGLVVMVLVMAAGALLPAWVNYDIISRDGAFQYVPTAKLFYIGSFMEALSRPQLPLFPFLIALMAKTTGLDFELSGRLVAATAFVAAAAGMFKLTLGITKMRWAALISVLLFLSNRVLLSNSVDCLQESLQLSFILWGNHFMLLYLERRESSGAPYLALSGVLFLLGAAVRTTTLIFPFAWIVLWIFHKREGLWIRLGGIGALLAAGASFVIINHDMPLFHTKKGFQIYTYLGMAPDLAGKFMNFPHTLNMVLMRGNPLAIFFAVYGVIAGAKGIYRIHAAVVTALFLTMFFLMGWTTERYILAPVIWLYPMAAWIFATEMKSERKIAKGLAILGIISCPVLWAGKAFSPPDPAKAAQRDAGKWILLNQGAGREVLTNRDRLTFYARAGYVPLDTPADLKVGTAIIALDVSKEGAREIKDALDRARFTPDRTFRSIYIYLPRKVSRAREHGRGSGP